MTTSRNEAAHDEYVPSAKSSKEKQNSAKTTRTGKHRQSPRRKYIILNSLKLNRLTWIAEVDFGISNDDGSGRE
jgi:hypothetical protein